MSAWLLTLQSQVDSRRRAVGVVMMMAVVTVRSHRIQVTVPSAEPSTGFSATGQSFFGYFRSQK